MAKNADLNVNPFFQIFHKYWALGNVTRQRDFILKFSEVIEKKVTRVRYVSRRSRSLMWYLPLDDQPQRVCKTFFLDSLSISHQIVSTALQKNDLGVASSDGRGKHNNRPRKTSTEQLEAVRAHINSFPCIESHYCRKDSKKKYLDPGLNVCKMYELYKESSINESVKLPIYRRIFDYEFNLAFHKPNKDQCDLCTKHINSNETEKEEMKAEYENHVANKERSRKSKSADKDRASVNAETSNFVAACFDLEEVLMIPKRFESSLYYKRRLNTFNMTVYCLGTGDGYSYIWNEGIAHRGGCEVASCVYSFLKTMSECGKKKVVLYSDNCCGQNKNKYEHFIKY